LATRKSNGNKLTKTLSARGSQYGSFVANSAVSQALKQIMHNAPNWSRLAPDQKECLEINAHKISRILCGNFDNHDSWLDQAGYATLVADRLEKETPSAKA
jgi:hypothetical protein